MNTKNIPCKIGFIALMMVLAVAVSCHVHTPNEALYHTAQVAERDILDPLLSDYDHLEEHHGQCLVKVIQPQDNTQVDLDLDALETTDPLIIAAKYPLTSSGYSYFTPLMYAIRLQAMPAVKSMLAAYDTLGKDHKLDKIKFSIPSDIQNTRPPNAGYTALLMALILQNVDVVQLLVANGAPVNMHFDQAVGELGGSTPIHVGVATQNALVVEAMLVRVLQPVDLEVQDSKNGSTPLDLSLSRNYMNVAKCLLKHGADPNRVDHTLGWRPLSRAVLKKDPAMVQLLLSYGANPYLADADAMKTTSLYKTLVQPCTARLDLVQLFFDHVIDACVTDAYGTEVKPDINFRFKDDMTSLHVAVLQGDVELIQLILDLGSDVDPKDASGSTPLHMAIEASSPSIVELLVRYGADMGISNGSGKSYLELATDSDQMAIVKLLIAHGALKHIEVSYVIDLLLLSPLNASSRQAIALYLGSLLEPDKVARFTEIKSQLCQDDADTSDLPTQLLHRLESDYISAVDNDPNPGEKTMLYLAAIRRETRLFRQLIDLGANINVKISAQGHTLLHDAVVEKQDLALVEEILSYPEVNVNQCMYDNSCTALHLAVIQGIGLSEKENTYGKLLSILRRLLSFRRTNVNAKNKDGNTALHFTVMLNRPKMTKAILGHNLVRLNIRNNRGETPLHLALRQNVENNDKMTSDLVWRCFTLLLGHPRTDVNLKNRNGYTPLHIAFAAHRRDLVQLLSAHLTADFNVEDSQGNTPLHNAVEMRSLSLVQRCLARDKTNVNVQNKLGNTPLHLAASANMTSITRALMGRHDIRPNIQNREGDAPIHSVIYCNALSVLPILLSDERVDLNIRDLEGYTPLHLAILYGKQKREAAEMLLRTPRLDLSISDEDGDTALDLAKEYGSEESVISMFLERMSMS
ncbi:MAG: ankyrin repeat domain-containing protein [Bacteroidota bacterium]